MNNLNNTITTEEAPVITGWKYFPTEKIFFQGNAEELQKKKDDGFRVTGGGNGSYHMQRDARAMVYYSFNGKQHSQCSNEEVKNYCGTTRVSENQLERMCMDTLKGKANAKISDSTKRIYAEKKAKK